MGDNIRPELTDAREAISNQISKILEGQSNETVETRNAPSKVINDSFSISENDYQLIPVLQDRALGLRMYVTKSELLRAGLHALTSLSEEEFLQVIRDVEKLKPGRRKNS